MSGAARGELERHLDACDRCRVLVGTLARQGLLDGSTLAAGSAPSPAVDATLRCPPTLATSSR